MCWRICFHNSSYHGNGKKHYFTISLFLVYSSCHWQNWLDWISIWQEKVAQSQKALFWEKVSKSQKKILHFITKFLNFSLKIKPGWSTWVLKPTLETRNVNDIWMVYFSWHKALIWILKNQWLLNFNCALIMIKLVEGLGILLSWPWKISLSILLTFWRERDVIVSWNKINHFATLKHLYMNVLLFF